MARIKVLELPSKVLGDLVETPFAIIIDQAHPGFDVGHIAAFKEKTGATCVLITADTIDIDRE